MKMIGFLVRLVFVVGLVIWLADRPGTAQIVWRDYVIETSAAVLALIIAAFAYGCLILYRIWRLIVEGPHLWRLKKKLRQQEEGQGELAKGFAAVAAGLPSEAGRFAVKARKMLGDHATTRLLLAQSAQLAGDNKTAKTLYESMLGNADTAILGFRGLIMAALKEGRLDEVATLIHQVEATKANVPWLNLVRLEIATRHENWTLANESLSKARKEKQLPAPTANKYEAALLLARAKAALRDSLPVKALELAERAARLAPSWTPIYLLLAEAQIVTKHERAALRTIERAWAAKPHPQFMPLLVWAMQSDTVLAHYKRVEGITRTTRDHPYSAMALAESALKADLWGEARRHLMALVNNGNATQMTYQLLARLEQRDSRDERAAAAWLVKAIHAVSDPLWLCTACGAAHEYWDATCHSCSAFNALEWGSPGKGRQIEAAQAPKLMQDYLT